ncbi:MAG: excinuclease ABC subunit UvrC, partial [Clostridiales bacterium]|nr:excinuclease ABC subunit UvrC [Clostridiales bacterium]
LHYIDGRLLDKDYELFDSPVETDGEAISGLLRQYYLRREVFPRTILLQEMPDDGETLQLLFTETAMHTVELAVPRRGDKRRLVETAVINAREEAERAMTRVEKIRRTIEWLGNAMALESPPVIMEAFDISNTGDADIVASMTVFENTRPKKSAYRRFMIKSLESQDDYHSMEEVIARRVKRFIDGDRGFSPLPDVMLVDGGANHAAVAKRVLDKNELNVPVFGMVKDDRHRTRALVTPDGFEIGLEANPAAFALIGTIQEETHRFAVEYHRERRSKNIKKSQLDEIPGIGEKRREALLKAFGSIKAIKAADRETLSAVVPKNAAEQVFAFFHSEEAGKGDAE